jgi:hypothetical protein
VKFKRNLSLSDDASAVLTTVGNASAYVSRVVTERYNLTQGSLAVLRTCGVLKRHVVAACEILRGSQWLTSPQLVNILIEAGLTGLAKVISDSELAALALRHVTQEYHSGNESFRRELDK